MRCAVKAACVALYVHASTGYSFYRPSKLGLPLEPSKTCKAMPRGGDTLLGAWAGDLIKRKPTLLTIFINYTGRRSMAIQDAVKLIKTACTEWNLGYDQSNRLDFRKGGETDGHVCGERPDCDGLD